MSTLRLETHLSKAGVGKPKSRMGLLWDKLTKPAAEPPYRRLPEYHIRVVKIKPGTVEHPLRVKLMIVDPRKFKYIALSYTWDTDEDVQAQLSNDSPPATKTIVCGGTNMRVRKNLYDALCQIRDTQSDVPVFVDALCIDFANPMERTAYLEIMGHVYARAASVIVFLGPRERHTDEVVLIMRKLVNAIDWRKISNEDAYGLRDPRLFERLGMDAPTMKQWREVYAFCHKRWFARRWGFFELALAKQALFLWGESCMEYRFLIDFGMICAMSGWLEELEGPVPDDGQAGQEGLTKMLGPVARLRSLPPWHPKHKDHETWMRDQYGLVTEQQRAWKFFEILLQSCEAFECKDPRDLAYAPLTFIRTVFAGTVMNKQWPRPDYGRPPDEILAQFGNMIQQHTGQASVLMKLPDTRQVLSTNDGTQDNRGRQSQRRVRVE